LASKRDYRRCLDRSQIALSDLTARADATVTNAGAQAATADAAPAIDIDALTQTQQAFGYTQEDLKFLLLPMVAGGAEGIGSMGADAAARGVVGAQQPLRVTSSRTSRR